jgi:hypothetical protein
MPEVTVRCPPVRPEAGPGTETSGLQIDLIPDAVGENQHGAAAAGAAAGPAEKRVQVPQDSSGGSLLRWLQERHGEGLTRVMGRCSYLLDEIAVRGRDRAPDPDSTLDVLASFAGG